ncbi:glycosyltransferase [Nocardioidaceae bacterium]|nr:glycosyltransferase [Nocardioidaceae bacterium]
MRVLLLAASTNPVREPFTGGLESHTHLLARLLAARGHEVTLLAPAGADPGLDVTVVAAPRFVPSPAAAEDVNAPSAQWMADHHTYLGAMLDLARGAQRDFDVVHDNSLHHLPVAMAPTVDVPVLTTLHTPPLPWLESAVALAGPGARFSAVSGTCRTAWRHCVDAAVVRNGVDTARWTPGPGGEDLVWTGRLTAEKAPHEAILAARAAGRRIRLAGPVTDAAYVEACVRPLLGPDAEYLGHLRHPELVRLVGESAVALVTPRWDEPYGLVAAEAMACGTPVAAYDRGALSEVVTRYGGVVCPPGDIGALAAATARAAMLPRDLVRSAAVRSCSAERMVDEYEGLYLDVVGRERAA